MRMWINTLAEGISTLMLNCCQETKIGSHLSYWLLLLLFIPCFESTHRRYGTEMGIGTLSMTDRQKAAMQDNMLNQMKTMQAMAVSRARDNFYWMSGIYAFVLTGATTARLKTGSVPQNIRPPLFVLPIGMAYQWDMGWGPKMNRIRGYYHSIMLTEQDRWFVSPESDEKLRVEALKLSKRE